MSFAPKRGPATQNVKEPPKRMKKKLSLRRVYGCTCTIREFSRSPCGQTCTEVRALQRLYFSGPSPCEGVEDGSHCRFSCAEVIT